MSYITNRFLEYINCLCLLGCEKVNIIFILKIACKTICRGDKKEKDSPTFIIYIFIQFFDKVIEKFKK